MHTPVNIGHIDYCYNAHYAQATEFFFFKGKVEKIKILYHNYEPESDFSKIYVAVDGKLSDAKYVEGFEEDCGSLKVAGYVVSLSECTVDMLDENDINSYFKDFM